MLALYVSSSHTHYSSGAVLSKSVSMHLRRYGRDSQSATALIRSMQNRRHTQTHRSHITIITYVRQKFSCFCCSLLLRPTFCIIPTGAHIFMPFIFFRYYFWTRFFFVVFSLASLKATKAYFLHFYPRFCAIFLFAALITTKMESKQIIKFTRNA